MAQPNVRTHKIDVLSVAVSQTDADRPSSIKVRKITALRLSNLGKKGETYDDIIVKLLNRFERKKVPTASEAAREWNEMQRKKAQKDV